jgi:hypothetical protein
MREANRVKREEEIKELFTNAAIIAVAYQTKKGTYTNSIQNSRMSLATKWMGSPSKTQYIDFNKSVYTKTLSKGTQLVQYRIKGQEGTYGD